MTSDEQLISAICKGEESAIEVLYERYHRYAYALAYRILHDPLASEDIVQDAFLSIWRKASSYQAQNGSVQSWIQAIVRHRAIDKIRASAHRDYQWTPLQADNEQDPPSEEPDVWEQAWQSEQHRIIHEVMEQIPGEQRMVIELAYFGGLTHARNFGAIPNSARYCERPHASGSAKNESSPCRTRVRSHMI